LEKGFFAKNCCDWNGCSAPSAGAGHTQRNTKETKEKHNANLEEK